MHNSKPTSQRRGLVFNIQKFSVHDGPGIRTTVFLKGCPLRCRWCCNPESQQMLPEISRNTARCLGLAHCGACLSVCQQGTYAAVDGAICRSTGLCTLCEACVRACPTGCISLVGRLRSAEDVLNEVSADFTFYGGGGGMTLSGGEVFLQADFALALCCEAHRHGLSVAVETSAWAAWETMRPVCAEVDYFLADIKHMDSRRHKEATGVDNAVIINNIKNMRAEFPQTPMIVRCPVVPGFNDDAQSVADVARFVGALPGVRLELLEYHRLGEDKYKNLGRQYALPGVAAPTPQVMDTLRSVAAEFVTVL